jgi:hypothetical protein
VGISCAKNVCISQAFFATPNSLTMKYFLHCLFITFLLASCTSEEAPVTEKIVLRNIQFHELNIDTLLVEPPARSGSGFFRLSGNNLYFFDDIFLTVSVFDTAGNFVQRYLGKGHRPDEIEDFLFANFLADSSLVFLGKSYNISRYDQQFTAQYQVDMDWNRKANIQYGLSDGDKTGTYGYNYYNGFYDNRWLSVIHQNKLIIPIWISPGVNSRLNAFRNYEAYYERAKTVGVVDLRSGKVEKIFGRRSPAYKKYGAIPNYDLLTLDSRLDSIYVSQAIDSMIQVYGPDYELAYEFGVAGQNMNTSYPTAATPMESEKIWIKAFTDYGYYYNVYCDRTSAMIFRPYTKDESNIGGLQIYEHAALIADVAVPKRFNIIGKIGEYYYADGLVNEDQLGLYRFKLP